MATIKGTLKTKAGDVLYPATSADKVAGLATVATSGSYNDLTNQPTIPDVSTKMDKSNPTGTGSFSLNRSSNSTVGTNSFAAGTNCIANNTNSFAQGNVAMATGLGSHAEGLGATSSGSYSHAEGDNSISSGYASHAEGRTFAVRKYQHTFGRQNIVDTGGTDETTEGTYIEIVGNGTGDAAANRSNARTLDWNGNETLAGNIKLGNHTTIANNSSSNITVTLPSSAGTIALTSDIPDTSGLMPKSGGTFTGDVDWSGSSQWLKPYLLAFKNVNTSSSPAYPYTGFYQWGAEWQVNARDANNAFVHNLLTINNSTKAAEFAGSVSAPSFYATSDRRLKENIKPAELNCGKVIDDLQIKEFNFIDDEDKKVVVGAIAQELQEILPEKYRATLVSGSEDTSYSINEGKLLFIAIGALKDEMKKVSELEEKLARLEKLLEK